MVFYKIHSLLLFYVFCIAYKNKATFCIVTHNWGEIQDFKRSAFKLTCFFFLLTESARETQWDLRTFSHSVSAPGCGSLSPSASLWSFLPCLCAVFLALFCCLHSLVPGWAFRVDVLETLLGPFIRLYFFSIAFICDALFLCFYVPVFPHYCGPLALYWYLHIRWSGCFSHSFQTGFNKGCHSFCSPLCDVSTGQVLNRVQARGLGAPVSR